MKRIPPTSNLKSRPLGTRKICLFAVALVFSQLGFARDSRDERIVRARLADIQKYTEDVDAACDTLEEKVPAVNEENATINQDLTQKREASEMLQSDIGALKSVISALAASYQEKAGELAAKLVERSTSQQSYLSTLRAERKRLITALTDKRLEARRKRNQAIRFIILGREAEADSANDQYFALLNEVGVLRMQLRAVRVSLANPVFPDPTKLEAQITKLTKEAGDLKTPLTTQRSALQNMKISLRALNRQVAKLVRDLGVGDTYTIPGICSSVEDGD
jgi:chromosome segregation ATPase